MDRVTAPSTAKRLLIGSVFSVPLLPLSQTPVEGAVLLAIGGREEIGYPHVNADHRCMRVALDGNGLIVRKGHPPDPVSFVERDAAIERAALAGLGVGELLF